MKTYYLYVFTPTEDECKTERTNAEILTGRGIEVPECMTPLMIRHTVDKLDKHNLAADVVDKVILLDGLRWKTLDAGLKLDIMAVAHRALATTSRRNVRVELSSGTLDFALKASW